MNCVTGSPAGVASRNKGAASWPPGANFPASITRPALPRSMIGGQLQALKAKTPVTEHLDFYKYKQ